MIFVGLICVQQIHAQIHNFSNFNVADGIEQSNILSITQAENGMLVYATYGGGLGVYDGYNFRSIKEKQGLSNNSVLATTVDAQGKVWVATRSGLTRLSSNVKVVESNYKLDLTFYAIAVNEVENKTWFGSGKGLYCYDNNADSVVYVKTSSDVLNASSINNLFVDSKNNLWAGTQKKGVFRVSDKGEVKRFSSQEGLSSDRVFTVIEGNNSAIYIGTLDGLNVVKGDSIEVMDLPKISNTSISITSSAKYKDFLVFGAYNKYVYFINPETNTFKSLGPKNGFNYLKVRSVFTDKESNLWFGVLGDGLVKYNPIFTYYDKKNGMLSNQIRSVYRDNETIFVGQDNGLNIIKNGNVVAGYGIQKLKFSRVYHINKFKQDIVLGTNAGIHFYTEGETSELTKKGLDLSKENVLTSFEDGHNLFIGGYGGLYVFNGDSIRRIEEIPSQLVYAITKYKGAIYVATDKGAYKLKDENVEFLSEEQGLVCNKVRSFRIDAKNNLWMATSQGVYMFNGKDFKHINIDQGLTSDDIYLIEIDARGNIWAGSNKGLDKINIASAYQHWNNSSNLIDVRKYGKNEGFNGVESNMAAVCLGAENELYFGTINGLFTYHLKNDKVNIVEPSVTLNNIKLNFKEVDWNNYSSNVNQSSKLPAGLELNYNQNNLIFEYVGVSLTHPQAVQYQYKLEGLDEEWLPVTKDRKAVYTAIPHGDYAFKLRASNSDGVWTKKDYKFTFSVLPPWWKTTWFYTLSVIGVLLIGYVIIVVRTQKLKSAKIELEEKVSERTKELRSEKEKVEMANSELAEQKKVVEVVNKNLTDSINYAKKIQEAILPNPSKLEEMRENVGILYLPKDVVSGDFYWYERVGNKLILAASDCTGHGVPGAFMSMIGIDNLNRIVLEKKITSPDKILQELNRAIKKTLKQDDEGSTSRDGMDIAISCFDLDTNIVSYSGAFRPLIYIRDNELFELKASRQPIGGSAPSDFEYELNEFEFKKGDVYYMFSDGYPDQFGGPKGKKFMNKRMKGVFMDIYNDSPVSQREKLKDEFISWMGNNEQIDDILVMCIKI